MGPEMTTDRETELCTSAERHAGVRLLAERAGGRPIRVAWDIRLSSRNLTGTGVYAARMLEHLAAHEDVEVQKLGGWGFLDRQRLLPLRVARTLLDIAWPQTGLPLAVRRLEADVLHAPAFVGPVWGSCPLVVTVHDTLYRRFPEQYPRWWTAYMNFVVPRVVRRAAALIAVSNHSKQDVVQVYGVVPERVHVVPHGVDHERFHPDAARGTESVLARYGVFGEYVLHVGALVRRKRIPVLLEAVAGLKARGRWGERQVVLAGPSSPGMPGGEEILAAVERLGLAGDVVFTGHVPDEWLPALYARAAALAFPSMYEGFGLPLIEAMACGTPVVAVAGSSVTEVVGDAGLLVPANDSAALGAALDQVLSERGLAHELRDRGLKRAAQFNWDDAARKTVEVYRSVVDESKRRRWVSG